MSTEVSAQAVKALREKTDAPMMECKKALQEAGGDFSKAEDILRLRLGNKAKKVAGRVAGEGVVAAALSGDQHNGAMVEVNCETDFVARNESFLAFASQVAELIERQMPKNLDQLAMLKMGAETVEKQRLDLVGKIGENVSIRRFIRYGGGNRVAAYIHGGARLGVLLEMKGGDATVAKDIAMHIAAAKPSALTIDAIAQEELAHEKEMARQKTLQNSKAPAAMQEKIIEGQIRKYYEEVVLLEQNFIKDTSKKVGVYLQSHNATVLQYTLFSLGEGLEKRPDFAEEVSAQVAQAQKKSLA